MKEDEIQRAHIELEIPSDDGDLRLDMVKTVSQMFNVL
jgi:hypothetical protein